MTELPGPEFFSDLDLDKEEDQFIALFRTFGFDDVRLERTELPQHIIDWVRKDIDDDKELEKAKKAFSYWKVHTAQGDFGVFKAAYPFLDLHGTGISLTDLEPEVRGVPEDFFICGLGDEDTLQKLRLLLVQRQQAG